MATAEIERPQGTDRSPKIPSSRYPLTHVHNGFGYEVYKVTRQSEFGLRMRVLVFEKQFGYIDPFLIHDKVKSYVQEGGEVVFATTLGRHREDVAVVTQEIRRVTLEGQTEKVLSTGLRVVRAGFQKHGIGGHLAVEAITRHSPLYVIGKSRTWRIPRMYQETGLISGIPPIDGPLTPGMEEAIRQILDRRTLAVTDLRTGICFGIYPAGESERFTRPDDNPKGAVIYDTLSARGFHPEKGDGFIYCTVVDQEAVESARARGLMYPSEVKSSSLLLLNLIPKFLRPNRLK